MRYLDDKPRAQVRVIAIERPSSDDHARRAVLMKLILFLAGVLVFVLAGTYSAGAEKPFPTILHLPNGFAPEGIATGRGTDFFVGSLAGGAIYKGDLRTGEGTILAEPVTGRAIAGIKIDRRTNFVFAAGTQSGKAFVFDGDTGAQLAEYQLASSLPSFVNDLVITEDAVYFTDSFRPFIYRLPLADGGGLPVQTDIEAIALGGEWVHLAGFNANGIDATPDGSVLIVMHSGLASLFAVDPASGEAAMIDFGAEAPLPTGDGILLHGETLYVMQNRRNQISVIGLDLEENTGTVNVVITDPAFRVPTTIARFGPWLYAVNARFGTPVTPNTDYDAVQVDR